MQAAYGKVILLKKGAYQISLPFKIISIILSYPLMRFFVDSIEPYTFSSKIVDWNKLSMEASSVYN